VRVCVWWWGLGGGGGIWTNRSILRRSFTNRDTQWVAAYVWSFSDKCWGGYSSLLPTQARWAQRCTRWVRLPTLHGMQASPTSEQVVEQVRVPSKQQSSRGLGETSSQMFSTSYEDVQIEHGGSCPHLAPSHLGVSFTQVLIATQGASPPPPSSDIYESWLPGGSEAVHSVSRAYFRFAPLSLQSIHRALTQQVC